MQITIRAMAAGDTQRVADIENNSFSQPWSQRDFDNTLSSDNYIYIVAEDNGSIVGYCGCVMAADEGDITNIAVIPDYRRMGIGAMLINTILRLAGEHGMTSVFLEVRESNEPARLLYESRGFEVVGKRPAFYQKPVEAAILMAHRI